MHRILSRFVAAAMHRCSPLSKWTTPFVVGVLVLFCANSIVAQTACTALPICDSVFVQPNINQGGNAFPPSSCLRTPRNPTWYRVHIARNGFLGFTLELSPEDQMTDDYDFAVFDATGGKTCDDLTLFDERSCNYADKTGNTGANGLGESNTANSRGSSFNARIPVKSGEEYLILISNYLASATSKGYRLNFASSDAGVIDRSTNPNTAPRLASVDVPAGACQVRGCTVRFTSDIRCASVNDQTFLLQAVNGAPGSEIPCRVTPSSRCASSPNNFERTFDLTFAVPLTRSGTYSLRLARPVLDLCGNAVEGATTLTITLNPQPLALTLGGYDYVCSGAATYLFAAFGNTPQIPEGRFTYEWSKSGAVLPDERRNFLLARELGEYRLSVEDTLTGCTAVATLRVRDGNDFKPRLEPSVVNLCANDSIRLDAGGDLENIQWFFRGFPLGNERSRYLWVSGSGSYSVRATRNGCEGTSNQIVVNSLPIPNVGQAASILNIQGNIVTCTVPAARYEWTLDGAPIQDADGKPSTGNRVVPRGSGKIAVRMFTDKGCTVLSSDIGGDVNLQRVSADAVLRIPDTLRAAQNQLVRIPFFLQTSSLDSLRRAGVTGFRGTIRMNARLLSPEDKRITSDTVQNLERRISAGFDLPERGTFTTAQMLDSLTFRAMLGNTSATILALDSLVTVPLSGLASLTAVSGLFTLTNISTRATIRLITSATTSMIISLTTSPNPAQELASVSYQASTVSKEPLPILLTLTDTFGRLVYAAPHRMIAASDGTQTVEEHIDTRNLPQGVYILVLYVGAERVSRRVEVVR
jgi:hypothetical protein